MNADTWSLYRKMHLIRCVEETLAEKEAQIENNKKQMRCPIHLSIGQEAVSAGVCENLAKDDMVYSTHRCHGHYLAKGGNLKKMIAELYGKSTGCCRGKGGSMHLIDLDAGFWGATPIVGNTLPVAVGAAFANKLKKNDKIVAVFIGDGTCEEGVFHESLNFASLQKLPVLFVCENNFFSVYTHLSERQPNREIYKLAEAHGIYSAKHDGYDVFKVFKATMDALNFMKTEKSPAFLEFTTYRWREHCGLNYDDHLKYRSKEEAQQWMSRDPVKSLEQWIINNKMASEEDILILKQSTKKNIEEAFKFAEESPFPEKKELYLGVYSE